MKQKRNMYKIFGLIVCFISLTSLKETKKPHLIVGTWAITDENTITLTKSKSYINQLYFGSDQLSSSFSFTNKKGKSKEKGLDLANQTYEKNEDNETPVVYFINTCDENFKLAFTIENLTKDSLELKYIKDVSSKGILLNREILKFVRIGGPPENISD